MLSPDLLRSLDALAQADRLLVALDFDGTLAPLVDKPLAARALPESAAAIARLESADHTWIAYISGRPLASLESVTEADADALLVGSHGAEIRFGKDGESVDLTADERTRLARLGTALESVVGVDSRIRLERKPVGFGVHTRFLNAAEARAVNVAAYAAAESVGGDLTIRDGKDIVEFSVRHTNKGDGIARLRSHVGATATFFAGDDVTDEDGFASLNAGDVGVKVGSGDSLASFRVADPTEFAGLLTYLATRRELFTASLSA